MVRSAKPKRAAALPYDKWVPLDQVLIRTKLILGATPPAIRAMELAGKQGRLKVEWWDERTGEHKALPDFWTQNRLSTRTAYGPTPEAPAELAGVFVYPVGHRSRYDGRALFAYRPDAERLYRSFAMYPGEQPLQQNPGEQPQRRKPGPAPTGDWPNLVGAYSGLYPELRENPKTPLAKRRDPDSTERMIRPGFLDIESRQNLIELARDGSAAHRLARRANALVLLDDGMSCEAIAKVLLLDDDTIRTWYRLYEEDGIEGLTNFSYEGSACQLSGEQQEKLKAWVATALPRTTRQVGAWIENEFGVVYEGRSGLIALLHRLGLEYHKPNVIPRKLDEEKQKAFIEGYEKLLNSLGDDEAVLFADAVHPTHAARPVGCWAPSQEKLAIEQTSGRQRINIHGAIDLETGQTRMIEALTIDAASTIRLLQSIEALYPMLALIHVFLDNARYHHAKLVQEWLALPGRRIKLHFIPTYCPHLNPIERLWGLMHRNVTHNKCYATCAQFADATLSFLREKVPGNWADLCDSVTDNFRVINPKDFRVMT